MELSFDERARRFVEETSAQTSDRLYGIMKPRYVASSEEEMSLTVAYPVLHWELNIVGNPHGGALVAMMDSVMGSLGHIVTHSVTPTISLNTSFLRSGPTEGEIIVKAKLMKLGRSILYFNGKAWAPDAPNKVIMTAEGTFRNFAE